MYYKRSVVLSVLLAISVVLYLVLTRFTQSDANVSPFLQTWIICFLPYFGACILVFLTPPAVGRWRIVELGIILFGALLLRALLLPQLPWLSRDSWRYVWDARVTLHGYSPYEYAPGSPILKSLRDALIYGNSRFRNVPTVYPPVAQAIYVLGYLLVPSNLFVLKAIFVSFDMLACVGLALLLLRRGLDPRLMILYAWCPLPIVEFAIEGHLDALTGGFIILTLLCAPKRDSGVGWRILLGVLVACATLTKIYPLLLLIVVTRRRDWEIPVACFTTIILAYIPYIILGHGQVFGFFSTYASEQSQNAGVVPLIVHWCTYNLLHLNDRITVLVEYAVDVLFVGPIALWIFLLRERERISMETATLVLIGTVYAVSTHIFPWYTTVLLLFVPLLIEPLWTHKGSSSFGGKLLEKQGGRKGLPYMLDINKDVGETLAVSLSSQRVENTPKGVNGKGIAIAGVWYFACTSLTAYYFRSTIDWTLYYDFVYGGTVLLLIVGIGLMVNNYRSAKERTV